MQCDHGGGVPATPEQTFAGLRARASLASSPLHLRVCPAEKVLKKCIDTGNRNLVSHAPGSKTDKGFYPVGSLSVRSL